MDFDRLYEILPKFPAMWSMEDISTWLNFIGLGNHSEKFKMTAIDGTSIFLLDNEDLINDLQITSSMIRKKILNWTNVGLGEYTNHVQKKLELLKEMNKENINMQLENIADIKPSEYQKKNSLCEEFAPSENTNPISSQQKYQIHENDCTSQISLASIQNNVISRNNINSNPFATNSLTADITDFSNFYNHSSNVIHPNVFNNNPIISSETAFPYLSPNFQEPALNHHSKSEEFLEESNYEHIPKTRLLPQKSCNQECELIIQPTEGTQTTFYCIKESGGKIGRHSSNQMVILEESVSRFHAEIVFKNKEFYIRDIGSTTGTFIKIPNNTQLEVGMMLELGSNQFCVEKVNCNNNSGELSLVVVEGPDQGQRLNVVLKDQLSWNSIGRKATNTFPFDDQHLSNMHAKFFILDNKFYLEDLSSTNGTWRRLSKESETSEIFPLSDQAIFKIGASSTFTVTKASSNVLLRKNESEIITGDCVICCENERDALYLPCKHNTACVKCSKNLGKCPICKLKIEDIIKIYRA